MTIPASMPIRKTYLGDGVTVNFPVPFKYFANVSDGTKQVQVVLSDSDGGNPVILVENTDYTMTAANQTAGTLTMMTAPAADKRITIVYKIPIEQEIDWEEFGRLPSQSIENACDKLTAIQKQQQEQLDRCVKVGVSSISDPEILVNQVERIYSSIDNVDAVADNEINVNIVATDLADENSYIKAAQPNAQAAAASATAAADSATSAATSATNAANSATSANTAAGIAMQKANATASSAAAAEAAKTYAQNAITDENLIAVATDLADENSYIKAAQPNAQAAAASATAAADSATSAEQWATKTNGKVDNNNYSAKYYAIYSAGKADNAASSATAAASSESNALVYKNAAQAAATDTNVVIVATDLADENSYIKAAQPNAQAAAASATAAADSATSAEQWATKTSGKVDGTNYSAKYYAIYAAGKADNAANSATSANTAANRALMFATAAAESEESAVASATAALNSAEIAETAASNILNNDNIKNIANHIVNINKTAMHVSEISTVSAHVISINTLSETIREYNTDIHGGHADTVFTQSINGGQADTTEFSESLHGGHADTRFPDKFTADMQTIADNITDIQNAEENAIRAETAAEYAEETAATIAADKAIIEGATTEFIRRYDSDQFQNTANATKYITALGGMTGYIMSVIAYLRSLGKIIAGGLADTTVFASTLHGGQADTTTFAESIHGGTADIIFN